MKIRKIHPFIFGVALTAFSAFALAGNNDAEKQELEPLEVRCFLRNTDINGEEMNLDCGDDSPQDSAPTTFPTYEKMEDGSINYSDEDGGKPPSGIRSSNGNKSTAEIPVKKIRPSRFSVVLQTGGYAGSVSPGMSFRFLKRNEVTLLGGYVSEKMNGAQLWQLDFKYQIEPFNDLYIKLSNGEKMSINPIHLGAGIIYGIHKDLFTTLPKHYPAGYYRPTAFRTTFNVGSSVGYRRVTLYVDYSALDVGAISYFWDGNGKFFRDNYSFFGLAGIGTLGFGMKVNLNRAAPKLN